MAVMWRPLRTGLVTCAMGLSSLVGCSSLGGSAIRTGPVQLPSYVGPVAIYSAHQTPEGAVDLGVVEVHALQQEATVETLLPQFLRKVADIGGNIAVIDGVRARFELAGRSHVETFYYTCTMGAACGGTRVYSTTDEIMLVSMFGRAMTTQLPAGGAPLIPKDALTPDQPPAATPPEESPPPSPIDIPPPPSGVPPKDPGAEP
jgi:hypothetical protein